MQDHLSSKNFYNFINSSTFFFVPLTFSLYKDSTTVVISLLYNNYEKQEMLVDACIQQGVALFITWDAGMEL